MPQMSGQLAKQLVHLGCWSWQYEGCLEPPPHAEGGWGGGGCSQAHLLSCIQPEAAVVGAVGFSFKLHSHHHFCSFWQRGRTLKRSMFEACVDVTVCSWMLAPIDNSNHACLWRVRM